MNAVTRLREATAGILGRVRSKPAEDPGTGLLFLFCGKSHVWRSAGLQFYAQDPLFRDAIDASDEIVRQLAGFSPSAAFSGEWEAEDWHSQIRSEIVVMVLAQMGITDIWRARGGEGAGFLGLSCGEISACYATGALTRDDAVKTIAAFVRDLRHPEGNCSALMVDASTAIAMGLCDRAPKPLEFNGEIVPGGSQLLTAHEDLALNRAYVEQHVPVIADFTGAYRYHVPDSSIDMESFAADVSYRRQIPEDAALYLSSFAGRAASGTVITAENWSWMVTSPYQMGAAATAALQDGYKRYATVGGQTIGMWFSESARRLGASVQGTWLLDAKSPVETLNRTLDMARETVFVPRSDHGRAGGAEAATIDLNNARHLLAPYAAYETLRPAGPVQYLARHDAWIVLGYDEMKAALCDHARFSHEPYDNVDRLLIGAEPEAHAVVRRIVARQFDPATFNAVEAAARALAPSLLKPRLDVVGDFAAPFACAAAGHLLGGDAALLADLKAAADALADHPAPFDPLVREIDRHVHRFAMFGQLRGDLGPGVSDEDCTGLLRFLWLASITTSERAIVQSAIKLVSDPALLASLRADPRKIGPFVEEVLRLYPPEHMMPRRMAEAVELGGVTIPAGAEVLLCTAAANRDPKVFEAAMEFRIDRPANPHLSFGAGAHHCSGTGLARRLVPVAVRALVDSPGLQLIQPIETIRWRATMKTLAARSLVIGT